MLLDIEREFAAGRIEARDVQVSLARTPAGPALELASGHAQDWPGITLLAPGGRWDLVNISVKTRGSNISPVLIGAHWDSRPWADMDPDPARRREPVPGANDGASGTAVLLELARVLATGDKSSLAPAILVFFDGEDSGLHPDEMFLGSRHFARGAGDRACSGAVIIDMVGDRELKIGREPYSRQRAAGWEERVFKAAHAGNPAIFPNWNGPWMLDDHIPLLDAGIPSALLIDFDYAYWHTSADTPDKCAPGSLEAVGRALLILLEDVGADSPVGQSRPDGN